MLQFVFKTKKDRLAYTIDAIKMSGRLHKQPLNSVFREGQSSEWVRI